MLSRIIGPVNVPADAPSIAGFLAWDPQPIPVLPIIAIVLAAAYVAGFVRLRRQRRRWPVWRAVSFLLGCAFLFLVTGLAIEGYGLRMFSVFVFQQMTLMIVVPPMLVLGSPGRLLLRATPHTGAGIVLLRAAIWGLRSRISRALLHPVLVIPLLAATLFGLYLTGIADLLLRSWAGHVSIEIAFLVVGVILAIPLVSAGPLPIRVSYPARAFDAFVEMQAHAAFGLVLTLSTTPFVPFFAALPPEWGLDPMTDQRWAGVVAWVYGEIPIIVILIATLARWSRQESRRAPRERAREDREMDAYNEYLQSLHSGSDPNLSTNKKEDTR